MIKEANMRYAAFGFLMVWAAAAGAALPSEITVKLTMKHSEYVTGERMRCIVDVANASADIIDVGSKGRTTVC